MKIKYLIAIVLSSLVLYSAYVGGQNSQNYEELLKVIAQDKFLRSPTVVSLSEAVLASATNLDMQLTAKILLAQALGARGDHEMQTNDIARAGQLWAEVIKDGTGTWQAAFAQFELIAVLGAQGKRKELIVKIKDGLAHLNLDILEQSQDPALKALRQAYGDRPNIFREAFKLGLVNALCDEGRVLDAKEAYQTIQDPVFAELMRQRIKLAEKEEIEILSLRNVLKAQVQLKPEALNVSPGILTAHVHLPEGYPVKNITSATCNGAAAERMMLNDDKTEMIIKFRRQDIEEGLALIGKSIDTNFVVQGVWRSAAGTNFFEGADSITKIVGAKEKEEKEEKEEKKEKEEKEKKK